MSYIVPITIDLEASSLDADSYPIEVGFCLEDGKTMSWLIKREPEWTNWSNESAKIHNITKEQLLNEGYSALYVANVLNEHLAGKIVYSDAQSHDEFWINALFNAAGVERKFEVRQIQSLFVSHEHVGLFYFKRKILYQSTVQHRAGNDAKVIQEALCISRDMALDKK